MRQSSPSPTIDIREDLKLLYQRRVALDRIIRSLEDYRQNCANMPVRVAGQTQGAPESFGRIAS